MGDSESSLPPSKKRAAGREISKENPGLDDEEDSEDQETGTFKRASEEVLATRKMVKVRRGTTTSSSSNPFAGIRLVAPSVPSPASAPAPVPSEEIVTSDKAPEDGKNDVSGESRKGTEDNSNQAENKIGESVSVAAAGKESSDSINEPTETKVEDDDKPVDKKAEGEGVGSEDKKEVDQAENEDKKDNGGEIVNSNSEETPLSSFQQLSSSKNAFTGLSGTGISTYSFSFGSFLGDGIDETMMCSLRPVPVFGQKNDQPSFGFSLSANGSSGLFGTAGSSTVSKSEGSGFPSMQEVPVETGEENERVAFSADSVLFEFFDGGWKERGKGEVKVNVLTSGTERARLVMRARGNYRLILNASLYPDMKLTNMDKKGITFACINSISEGKDGLSTFALKFKDIAVVEEFRRVVTEHKGKTGTALKTPENSPKASG